MHSETEDKTKAEDAQASEERQYWLMKAEPETRIERGHDISFSIDDLADRSSPEPWDGKSLPVSSPAMVLTSHQG